MHHHRLLRLGSKGYLGGVEEHEENFLYTFVKGILAGEEMASSKSDDIDTLTTILNTVSWDEMEAILDYVLALPADIDVESLANIIVTNISDGKCTERWTHKLKPYVEAQCIKKRSERDAY